jgi:hypothetical protein
MNLKDKYENIPESNNPKIVVNIIKLFHLT